MNLVQKAFIKHFTYNFRFSLNEELIVLAMKNINETTGYLT